MAKRIYTQSEVIARLKEACKEAGSLRAWARAYGCSAAYVSDVLLGKRDPGPKILGPFGLERCEQPRVEQTYQRVA